MRVFISHQAADLAAARELAAALGEAGHEPWLAEDRLLPGANFAAEIAEALETSSAMVVIISPASADSVWMRREIEFALGSQQYTQRLFPLVIGAVADEQIPWILRRLQPIRAGSDRRAAISRVVEALSRSQRSQSA